MAEQRTVDIFLDATVQTQIRELTGSQRFYEALGYLTSWNMTFGYVRITGGFYSGNPELIATYKTDAKAGVGYCIGAVWHGDHFGFHS